ncbi:peroxiredoxin [Heliobacterium chlorum]|uniref:Peroxiredoxin n=1 Tax=Heliobacterium chlorum TaxID=2698 RepID=A0ABR7T191_HELCL|nr:peroxiredoxin [Heliobacterium chlorum]MBC9784565.1 peroxiredoxin [Heliobacterium chlorum]
MKATQSNLESVIRIGMKAPDFTAVTTFGTLRLSDLAGKWVVFFSHPGDFTPVCTTEFIAFAKYSPYFSQRNVQLLGLSIDSNPAHLAWVHNIYQNTGVQIPFPVIADRSGEIARLYGMIAPDVSATETVRNTFIIDDRQNIRAYLAYPLTNGRNIPEILRLVDALQTSDREGIVTPANWVPGQPTLVPPPRTYGELLEREKASPGLQCVDWYWCYKQPASHPVPCAERDRADSLLKNEG